MNQYTTGTGRLSQVPPEEEPNRQRSVVLESLSQEPGPDQEPGAARAVRQLDHASVLHALPDPLLILTMDLEVVDANARFCETFGVAKEELVGVHITELEKGTLAIPDLRLLLDELVSNEKVFTDHEVTYEFEQIGSRVLHLSGKLFGDPPLILVTIRDVLGLETHANDLQIEVEALRRDIEVRTAQVHELTRSLILAEHEERKRIAQVLHDDLQQQLYGLKITLDLLNRPLPEKMRGELQEQGREILGLAINLTRTLSTELCPPILSSPKLEDTLIWIALRKRDLYDLDVSLDLRDPIVLEHESQRVLLYQLLREILFNVAKHAGVKEARIIAWKEGERAFLRVEDDGVGFDVESAMIEVRDKEGFGLASVKNRLDRIGGSFHLESRPGDGTRVTICLPNAE